MENTKHIGSGKIDKIIREGQNVRIFKRHASASDHADNVFV